MEKIEVTTEKQLESLGSAFTIEGLAVDEDNLNDMFAWIEQYSAIKTKRVYITAGRTMNHIYNLAGMNKYPADVHIVSVDLNDLESPNKLILSRFEVGGRWLDDIIANNRAYEKEEI